MTTFAKIFFPAFLLCALYTNYASAQTALNAEEVIKIASRLGISAAKVWLEHENISVPPSDLPLTEQSLKIETALKQYEDIRNGYSGISTALAATQVAAGAVVGGAVLYGGPQAIVTVPLTLLGASSIVIDDMLNSKVEELGKKHARLLLSRLKEAIIDEAGVDDWADLVGNNSSILQETLAETNGLLVGNYILDGHDPNPHIGLSREARPWRRHRGGTSGRG